LELVIWDLVLSFRALSRTKAPVAFLLRLSPLSIPSFHSFINPYADDSRLQPPLPFPERHLGFSGLLVCPQLAGILAFQNASAKANPVILEPVVQVEIIVP
jgi:hypothetical protein